MKSLDNKKIQKKRMMSYFINATIQVIKKKGIEGVTIREVANLAGYNSATIYNYFKNLDHLIFFAAISFMKDYVKSLPSYTDKASNSLEKWILTWECFCLHAFKQPEIYYAIFFSKLESLDDSIKEYYSIFPKELGIQRKDLLTMLLKDNMFDRGIALIEPCIEEGFFRPEDLHSVNEITILLCQGMLTSLINKKVHYSVNESVEHTIEYMKKSLSAYQISPS